MDVICSTSSILNLLAISMDRYLAVIRPIFYAKAKGGRRICVTIASVWVVSVLVGVPIVIGFNEAPNRRDDLCVFYNHMFIISSSMISFFVPAAVMTYLYYKIFVQLRKREHSKSQSRIPIRPSEKPGTVIENKAQARKLPADNIGGTPPKKNGGCIEEGPTTNTGSGSQDEEEDRSPSDACQVIPNEGCALYTVDSTDSKNRLMVKLPAKDNINEVQDSGYVTNNLEETVATDLPNNALCVTRVSDDKVSTYLGESSAECGLDGDESIVLNNVKVTTSSSSEQTQISANKSSAKKNNCASRFVSKTSLKKKDKVAKAANARRERKAIKTLAIVLGVFLVCWLPFFTCNTYESFCVLTGLDCSAGGINVFVITTWLGYINSFVNPIIYTIFNPEFRKAFKKILKFH